MAIEQLNPEQHRNLRVLPVTNFSFLEKISYMPLLAPEFMQACIDCPIVFIRNPENEEFQPVAMFSLIRGHNAFSKNGEWQSLYLPVTIQQAPFKLVSRPGKPEELFLGIDTAAPEVSETEGEPLFDDNGKETEYLNRRKAQLTEYAKQAEITRSFVRTLVEKDLMRESTLNYETASHKGELKGIYIVNEDKLKELPAEDYVDMRNRGILNIIYAHLMSLCQVRRLAKEIRDVPAPAENQEGLA